MFSGRVNNLFRSLRFRLAAWNTAVVLLCVGVSLLLVGRGLEYTLLQEIDGVLLDETIEMGLAVEAMSIDSDAIHREMDRKALAHRDHGWFVQLLSPGDQTLWSSGETPSADIQLELPDHSPAVLTVGHHRVAQRKFEPKDKPAYWVRVAASLESIEARVDRRTRITAMVGLVIAIIAPIGGYWLAGRATQPLAEIIQTAARLRPSDMRKRLRMRGTGDELDQLSLTINRLSDRIANYLDRHRDFIANAAHELRSPLAAIQSSVEVALGSERSTEEYKDLLDSIMTECQQLAKLVNQLLQLAENDADSLELPRETVRLDEAVERSLDMFRAVAEDRGIKLEAADIEPAPVQGDLTRLRQVVNNLVDNAIKYTPSGGKVTVSLRRMPERMLVELSVADTGPGIPPEDLPHVFERFYRASRARTRREQGTGLGLAICQSIVNAHGGQIRVSRTGTDGTTFVVLLPSGSSHETESAGQD